MPFPLWATVSPLEHWNLQGPSSGVLGATRSVPSLAVGFRVHQADHHCNSVLFGSWSASAGHGSPERVRGGAPPLPGQRSVRAMKRSLFQALEPEPLMPVLPMWALQADAEGQASRGLVRPEAPRLHQLCTSHSHVLPEREPGGS